MSCSPRKSVDDHRRSVVVTAAAHPFNAVPAGGALLVLLSTGLFLAALTVFGVDALLLLLALQLAPLRRRMQRRAEEKARLLAAQSLGPAENAEWKSLHAMVRRTDAFNARRADMDRLLDSFLNLGLAYQAARRCADMTMTNALPSGDGELGELTRVRREATRRTERALAALHEQLDLASQRIRLGCDMAVAEHCEARAELWLPEPNAY